MKGQKRPKTGLFCLSEKLSNLSGIIFSGQTSDGIIKSVRNHIFRTDLRWYYTHRSRENLIKKTIDK